MVGTGFGPSMTRKNIHHHGIGLELIPKTGEWSIILSGMDARKGGCKDAIESMELFG
jgi:hypothetical protein